MYSVRQLEAPDSQLLIDAREFVRTVSEPYLFNHVMRSWLFAVALAKSSAVQPDPELLAVAALLHDLGLTERYATDACRFEVDGANAARDFLKSRGMHASDLQCVWDAIALHTTRSIAVHKDPVTAYCHHGVQVDISGIRCDQVERGVRAQTLADFPRLSLKSRLTECLCSVVRRKPDTAFDNFLRDFGERHVPEFKAPSSVDRLHSAPYES